MIIYQKQICRVDLRNNPHVLYAWGDNMAGVGFGGQAKEMRGEPNGVGIPTKRAPYVFLTDADYKEWHAAAEWPLTKLGNYLHDGGAAIFPADGIGTGLADLEKRAPLIWRELCTRLELMGIENGL